MSDTTQPPSLEPGWYGNPDGSNSQRWWNGTNWTADSRPVPNAAPQSEATPVASATTAPPHQPPAQAAAPAQAPRKRGIGCVVFVILLVVSFVVLFVGCTAYASNHDGVESPNGCSELLPSDAFHDCLYREGQYSGIDDVPDQ